MAEDFLPIKGYDHVEFYVGNARQAAHFYDKTFGFRPVAKAGLETGVRDRASYLMEQGNARFLLTSAYGPDHDITRHCALHGDGVKAIIDEDSWILVRPSNTEHAIRISVESVSEKAEQLFKKASEKVKSVYDQL